MYRDEKPPRQRSSSIARVIAGLVAAAVILIVGFLEVGTNVIVVHTDDTETRTIQGDPIVITGMAIADFACLQGVRCDSIAQDTIQGIFPRDGVSLPAAMIGGILVPYVLISCSAFLGFRMLSGWTRIVIAGSLSVAGLVLLIPPGALLYLALKTSNLVGFIGDAESIRMAVLLAVIGSTSLTGGLWLFLRAYRGVEVEW